MPRKPKTKLAELPAIPAELLEQFGSGPMAAEAVNAAAVALKKDLIERALGGEINHYLGYPPVLPKGPPLPTSATIRACSATRLHVSAGFFDGC